MRKRAGPTVIDLSGCSLPKPDHRDAPKLRRASAKNIQWLIEKVYSFRFPGAGEPVVDLLDSKVMQSAYDYYLAQVIQYQTSWARPELSRNQLLIQRMLDAGRSPRPAHRAPPASDTSFSAFSRPCAASTFPGATVNASTFSSGECNASRIAMAASAARGEAAAPVA